MSAWDSKRTTVIHRFLTKSQRHYNEIIKRTTRDWNKPPKSIFKSDDLSLEALMKIDPERLSGGRFSLRKKPIREFID